MAKPSQVDATWAKQSLRQLQWRALLAWLGTFAIAVVVVFGGAKVWGRSPAWSMALLFPQIFLFGCIGWAYRRGIRDSEQHGPDA
jgi:hypothetical protein